jgi:hypothetical protein
MSRETSANPIQPVSLNVSSYEILLLIVGKTLLGLFLSEI